MADPATNAAATEYFGEAPSNKKACALTTDKDHCKNFHADDEEYFKQIWYWTTPTKECLDGRGADLQGLFRVDQGLDRGEGLT